MKPSPAALAAAESDRASDPSRDPDYLRYLLNSEAAFRHMAARPRTTAEDRARLLKRADRIRAHRLELESSHAPPDE